MRLRYVAPTIARVVFKILITYIILMLVLNIYLFVVNMYRLSGISYIIQTSVEMNNYIPQHDLDAINNLIAAYTYTEQEESQAGKGIPFLNRVVTDVRILCYQQDDDIFTDKFMGKPENKLQQGDIVYCGLAYKYHFIMPMLWWEWRRPAYDDSKKGSLKFSNDTQTRSGTSVIGSDSTRSFFSVGSDESFQMFHDSAVEIDTAGIGQTRGWTDTSEDSSSVYDYNTTGRRYADRTLLIKPIICWNDYADLSQEKSYSGG